MGTTISPRNSDVRRRSVLPIQGRRFRRRVELSLLGHTNQVTGLSFQMTAVDTSGVGFNLAQAAFGNSTNGDTSVGVVDVVATKLLPVPLLADRKVHHATFSACFAYCIQTLL